MPNKIATSLVLVLALSALGGPVLAQAGPTSSPSPSLESSTAPAAEVAPAQDSLSFVDPKWRKMATKRGPVAREDHTWTVDSAGRFAYLFGGRDGDQDFGDLWRYDLETDRWKQLSPQGKRPEARFGHSAVWVEGSGLTVFAGQRGADFFNDLWVFDPDARKWRELPDNGAVPKVRYGSCMVLGPDGRLWISHGFTSAGRFDDTRAYNQKTQRWADITPQGRKPGERCLHDCFTSASGEPVLYGGQDNGAFALGDLWSWAEDRQWQRQDDPGPRPRRLYALTEAGPYAYVFGGAGADNSALDDLWRVDRETLQFERVRVAGYAPSARYGGTLVTDWERGRLLLFGGQASAARNDVWELVDQADPTNQAREAMTEETPSDASPEPTVAA